MPRDYVVSGTYDPTGPGVLRNEYRKWVSAHDWLYAFLRAVRWVVIHPKTWPGIVTSGWLLSKGAPFWLVLPPLLVEPVWKADKSLLRVFGSVIRSRILTPNNVNRVEEARQVLGDFRNWFRVKRGWATGARAAGFVQRGPNGAVPRLHSWEVTNAGISAWVANGKFGWTADRLQEHALELGTGIRKCRSVTVVPGQFLSDAQVFFNFADPLRTEIPITKLPVPPTSVDPQRRKLCIGFNAQGEVMFVDRHLSLLLIGLPGAGKTTEIGTLVTSQLQSGEPFELWVADPNEGVDLSEFGEGSPIVRSYAYDKATMRKMVLDLHTAMKERMRLMRGREKYHNPTQAMPRWFLIIDELVAWHNALQGKETKTVRGKKVTTDYEQLFQEIMASQRRCAITTIGNTQIPFDHAMGKAIAQLFPQKIIFRCSATWITSAVFGPGAEQLGAQASKIEKKYPGIGFSLNQDETELERFRGPYMTKGVLRLIANGILPDGVATTEEQQAQRDNRPQVIYRWDHPEQGLLYIGISVNAFERAQQHWSNPDKALFMDEGVTNTVVVKLTAESCAEQLGQGRTVRQVAEETEKTLIQTLHPKLNIAHNGARPRDRKAITV